MDLNDLILPLAGASDGGLHSAAVQTAVIGGVFALLGVLLSFLLDRGGRRSRPEPDPDPTPEPEDDDDLETELRKRAERAERELTEERTRCQLYRDYLIRNHIDPETGTRYVRRQGEANGQASS